MMIITKTFKRIVQSLHYNRRQKYISREQPQIKLFKTVAIRLKVPLRANLKEYQLVM